MDGEAGLGEAGDADGRRSGWAPPAGPPAARTPAVPPGPPAWEAPGPADPGFRSARSPAHVVAGLLALSAVLSAVAVAGDLAEYHLLTALIEDPLSVTEPQVAASDRRQVVIGVAQVILYLATGIAFIVWLRRTYRNLVPLGARALRWAPGWTVGAWFVPVLNLWRPKQLVNDVWRASAPDLPPGSADWQDHRVPGVLALWWGAFLLSSWASMAAGSAALRAEEAGALRDSALQFIVADAVGVVAALLALWLVLALTRRQERRAAERWPGTDPETIARPARWILVSAATSLALAGGAVLLFDPVVTPSGVPAATRGADGTTERGGTIAIDDLRPQDCFDDPGASSETQYVYGVEVVPCDEPHTFEVFAAPQLPQAADAPFPGENEVFDEAAILCEAAFGTTVSGDFLSSPYDLFVIHPSADSWTFGDREVLCALYRIDGRDLESPVERVAAA